LTALTPAIEGVSRHYSNPPSPNWVTGKRFSIALNASAIEFKTNLEANPEIAQALDLAL
jgi:hypothetical protein